MKLIERRKDIDESDSMQQDYLWQALKGKWVRFGTSTYYMTDGSVVEVPPPDDAWHKVE